MSIDKLDAAQALIAIQERELAQMAKRVSELEAKLAEAGRAVRCHESLLLAVRQSIAALECGGGVGHEVARLREAMLDAERKEST